MRTFMSLALLAGFVSLASADDDKKPADEKKPSLQVGDVAPPLKASQWLQGNEVAKFEPGKVYVVEFWATWCGPCIAIMPHVAELQREFRDAGVTVIGFSAEDKGNTAEKVAKFVEQRGKKLGYTFAFADNRDTYDAYMKAAGQGGIPCSYVIGKDGKLAFIGHPALLDEVLPKVVAGTWDAKTGADEVAKIDAEFDKVYAAVNGNDYEVGLKAFSEFELQRPKLAKSVYLIAPRLAMLIKAKKFDEAASLANHFIAESVAQEDPYLLRQISATLRSPAARAEQSLVKMAVTAAEGTLKLSGDKDLASLMAMAESLSAAGDAAQGKAFGKKAVVVAEAAVTAEGEKKTPMALIRLAEALAASGDATKAKEIAQQAIDAAPEAGMKRAIQKMAEKFGIEPKDGGDK